MKIETKSKSCDITRDINGATLQASSRNFASSGSAAYFNIKSDSLYINDCSFKLDDSLLFKLDDCSYHQCNDWLSPKLDDYTSLKVDNSISLKFDCEPIFEPTSFFKTQTLFDIDFRVSENTPYSSINNAILTHHAKKYIAGREDELNTLKNLSSKILASRIKPKKDSKEYRRRERKAKFSWEVFNSLFQEESKIKEKILLRIDKQIALFSLCEKKQIKHLSSQLQLLRDEYDLSGKTELVCKIGFLIWKTRFLLEGYVKAYIKKIKGVLSFLYNFLFFRFKIDRRSLHRRIIRFLFKNLSDNSGTDAHNLVNKNWINQNVVFIKSKYHEVKTRYTHFIAECSAVKYKQII